MSVKAKSVLGLSALMIGSLAGLGRASQEFVDPSGKFKVVLAGDWRAVSYSDAVGRSRTEFVYRDRSEGLLKVTRENLSGRSIEGFAREEEEGARIYRAGFEVIGKESFGGGPLRGLRLAFYYVEGGRRMAATYYYLQDGDAVWVLRFTGRRGSLDTIRNVTDQIARSFRALA